MPPALDLDSASSVDAGESAERSQSDAVDRKAALEQRYIELLEKRIAALEALVKEHEPLSDVSIFDQVSSAWALTDGDVLSSPRPRKTRHRPLGPMLSRARNPQKALLNL